MAVLAGFSLAHLADNLLNDLSDYRKGIDDPEYFRALYGPHPVIDGLVPPGTIKSFVALVLLLDALLALVLSIYSTPLIALLAVLGAVIMALYAGIIIDAKSMGLGEILVGIVWGPIMAGGTLLAMAGHHSAWAAAIYLPYAATVSLVLIGKHMDKYDQDRAKGVGTLPVRLGLRASSLLAAFISPAAPPVAALALYKAYGSPHSLMPLVALASSSASAAILVAKRPAVAPRGWRVWPLWYVAAAYLSMDSLGRNLVAGLLATGLYLSGNSLAAILAAVAALALEAINVRPLLSVVLARKRKAFHSPE